MLDVSVRRMEIIADKDHDSPKQWELGINCEFEKLEDPKAREIDEERQTVVECVNLNLMIINITSCSASEIIHRYTLFQLERFYNRVIADTVSALLIADVLRCTGPARFSRVWCVPYS